MSENVIQFGSALTREEAEEYVRNRNKEVGVIIVEDHNQPSGFEVVPFGQPKMMEILWMAKQLEMFALYDNEPDI